MRGLAPSQCGLPSRWIGREGGDMSTVMREGIADTPACFVDIWVPEEEGEPVLSEVWRRTREGQMVALWRNEATASLHLAYDLSGYLLGPTVGEIQA